MASESSVVKGLSIAGSALLLTAGSLWLRDWYMTRDATRIAGVVVAFDLRPSDGHFVYAPVVQYSSESGPRRVIGEVASFPAAYEIGESANVLIAATDAEHVVIDSVHERHFLTLLFGGLGALAVSIATGAFVRARRYRN
jgi:hypothetical protein